MILVHLVDFISTEPNAAAKKPLTLSTDHSPLSLESVKWDWKFSIGKVDKFITVNTLTTMRGDFHAEFSVCGSCWNHSVIRTSRQIC